MIASVRAELRRLLRWPTLWVLVGVWLSLSLTFGYLFNYLTYRSESSGAVGGQVTDGATATMLLAEMMPNNAPVILVQGMPMFGGAIVLVLAALAIGSGYSWGTWKTVFTMGPRRRTALGGTLVALALALVGLVVVTFGLDLAASLAVVAAESQPLDWPSLADTAQGLGSGLLIVAMWASVGVLLGTLARGPALAVGLGLVWALVVENLLRGVASLLGPVEAVTNVLPGTAAGSLGGALGARGEGEAAGTPGVMTVLDAGPAVLLLGAYVLLFVGVAGLLTTRRDVS